VGFVLAMSGRKMREKRKMRRAMPRGAFDG